MARKEIRTKGMKLGGRNRSGREGKGLGGEERALGDTRLDPREGNYMRKGFE